ncbi:MAG: HEPN domain-containing protein, partial [Gaiellaceae bacterium]
RWVREWKDIGTTATLLYGTLLVELPPEFELLALTQALETFHRHVYEGTYLHPDEYAKVSAALTGAIPTGTPSDLKQALTKRIEYGNEYSQRKRFHELLSSLDDNARELLRIDKALLNRVVDERNHLTHRLPESDNYIPMDNVERRLSAQKLKAFLFLLLLSRLHFTGEDVKARYPMSRWGWASRS